MGKVLDYIANCIPYMLCATPIIILIRIFCIARLKKNGIQINWLREIGILLFFMFIIGVASQTIIPKINFGMTSIGIVNSNLFGEVNLIPGKVFVDTYRECFINHYPLYFIINFMGNVCLFLPIGFGIPLFGKNILVKRVILIALLSSLFIELCQLPQARGTDIDDLWINTLGAVLGYIIYSILAKTKAKTLFDRFKIK